MLLETVPLWVAATNTYVLARESSGPALVIDAPPNDDGLAGLLARHDLYPAALIVTHGHIDHCGGAGTIARTWKVSAHVHPDDGPREVIDGGAEEAPTRCIDAFHPGFDL